MTQDHGFVPDAFTIEFRGALQSNDPGVVRRTLNARFAEIPSSGDLSAALEATALAVVDGLPGLPCPVLATVIDGFGWAHSPVTPAVLDPDTLSRVLARFSSASLYEGVCWQAGKPVDTAIAKRLDLRRPGPRLRRAAAVMTGRGVPEGGVKSVTWLPSAYKRWTRSIESLAPSSYEYFDRARVRWLKVHADILEELNLARACLIGGLVLLAVTHLMMWFYIDVLPDEVMVGSVMAYGGIALVFAPLFALGLRFAPR